MEKQHGDIEVYNTTEVSSSNPKDKNEEGRKEQGDKGKIKEKKDAG